MGLENDCHDLKDALHRLLTPGAEKTQPAKKVNQWLFVSFTPHGMDAWVGPFFFNDGNLSGATVANQFHFVVMGLESIGCELLGVSMDAGGCNARFAEEFFRELKKLGHKSWHEDDDCYSVNFWDPSRRIYVWFCITHLMKAFRNALLASQHGGARFLKTREV